MASRQAKRRRAIEARIHWTQKEISRLRKKYARFLFQGNDQARLEEIETRYLACRRDVRILEGMLKGVGPQAKGEMQP